MATAKPHHPQRNAPRAGPRRHRWRNAILAAALLAALAIALSWNRLHAQAVIATSYGARIACTCHYVARRGLRDCRKDFEPGMALVMLSDNPATHTITARLPLLAQQSAGFRNGPGCQLQGWTP